MALHHVAIRVTDCQRSAAFYSGLLGLPELRRSGDPAAPRSIWLRLGGAVLMLEQGLRGTGPDAGSGHLLALAVDDLADWEARLLRSGVAIADRSEHTLYVQDPDGHRVGLSRFPLP